MLITAPGVAAEQDQNGENLQAADDHTQGCLLYTSDHKVSDAGCGYGAAVAGLSGAAAGESVLYCLLGHQFDRGGISVCWFDTQ